MGCLQDMVHLMLLIVPPRDSGTAITWVNVLKTQLFSLKVVSVMMLLRCFLRCPLKRAAGGFCVTSFRLTGLRVNHIEKGYLVVRIFCEKSKLWVQGC